MTVFNKVVKITAAAGSAGEVEALEVPPAQMFKLTRVIFIFPSGLGGDLGLAVKYGIHQICPDRGLARGDATEYELYDDTVINGSEKLSVYYQNDNATNALEAFVILEGEIIRE